MFDLTDAIAAMLRSDRDDHLWPTVVVDELGVALGLTYSSIQSLRSAMDERRGVYWSRSRGALWRKGETSGDIQELIRIDLDCDRDALRFTVRQHGSGFCHLNTRTCWGDTSGLARLEDRLGSQATAEDPGSYTARLQREPTLLAAKIREEAAELVNATERADIVHEAADVLYFTLVKLAQCGIRLAEVGRELDRRALRVMRRRGDAKLPPAAAAQEDADARTASND